MRVFDIVVVPGAYLKVVCGGVQAFLGECAWGKIDTIHRLHMLTLLLLLMLPLRW